MRIDIGVTCVGKSRLYHCARELPKPVVVGRRRSYSGIKIVGYHPISIYSPITCVSQGQGIGGGGGRRGEAHQKAITNNYKTTPADAAHFPLSNPRRSTDTKPQTRSRAEYGGREARSDRQQ